jgi:hypothetical protein
MTNYRETGVPPIQPSVRFLLPVGLTLTLMTIACGARSSSTYAFRTAPNPNGCYVELFPRDQLKGDGDYVNGPARYPRTSDFRPDGQWRDGVRSVRTGPASTVTLWSEENYRGALLRVGPSQRNERINDALSAAAASLQISCN